MLHFGKNHFTSKELVKIVFAVSRCFRTSIIFNYMIKYEKRPDLSCNVVSECLDFSGVAKETTTLGIWWATVENVTYFYPHTLDINEHNLL